LAAGLRRTGVRPACLELSADDAPGPATMLLVFDGLEGEAALLAARAAKLLATAGGTMLGARDAERQWQERHAIAERWAAARRGGAGEWPPEGAQFDYAHVGVPLGGLPAVRATAHALVERHGLVLIEEGLWHWPELYSVVVSGPPGPATGIRATIDGVCAAAVDAGGTLAYCRRIGRSWWPPSTGCHPSRATAGSSPPCRGFPRSSCAASSTSTAGTTWRSAPRP